MLKFIQNIETSIRVQLVLIEKLGQKFDTADTYLKDLQNLAIFSQKECMKIKKSLTKKSFIKPGVNGDQLNVTTNDVGDVANSRCSDSTLNSKIENNFGRLLDKILSPSSAHRNHYLNLMDTEKPKYEICKAPNSFPNKIQFLSNDLVSPINKSLGSVLHSESSTADIHGPRNGHVWIPSSSAIHQKHTSHDPFDMLTMASPNHSMSMSNIEYSGAVEVSSPCRAEMEDMMTLFAAPLSSWLLSADKRAGAPAQCNPSTLMDSSLQSPSPSSMPHPAAAAALHVDVNAVSSATINPSPLDITVDSLPPPPPPPLPLPPLPSDRVEEEGAKGSERTTPLADTHSSRREAAGIRTATTARRTAPAPSMLIISPPPQSPAADGSSSSSSSGRDGYTSQQAGNKDRIKGRSPMVYRNYSSGISQASPRPSPSFASRPHHGAFRAQSPNYNGINSNKLDLRKVEQYWMTPLFCLLWHPCYIHTYIHTIVSLIRCIISSLCFCSRYSWRFPDSKVVQATRQTNERP